MPYGAASYLRVEDNEGNVKCSFVMGKARLAPIKPLTIPRMELSAAVVATKLDRICRQELSIPIDQSKFWTDSTCVLRYIENQDKRFQTFVANRIAAIHSVSSPFQWTQQTTLQEACHLIPLTVGFKGQIFSLSQTRNGQKDQLT